MRVVPVPVRQDNYAYLIIDEPSATAVAVDPFDVSKVSAAAEKDRRKVSGHNPFISFSGILVSILAGTFWNTREPAGTFWIVMEACRTW